MKVWGVFFGFTFLIMGIIGVSSNEIDKYSHQVSMGIIILGIALIYLCLNPKKNSKKIQPISKPLKQNNTNRPADMFPIDEIEPIPFPIPDEEESQFQLRESQPSADYIKTIFLHMFEKHPYKEDDSFPEYFYYEYGIINMPMYFNQIKDEGLITSAPPQEILGLMKVSELKDILSKRDLKKSGKKSELIEYILSHIDVNELPIINENYFSLSQTGKNFIEYHHDYIVLKQHPEWGIKPWEYQNEKVISNTTKSFNEIILSLLNKKILNIKKLNFEITTFEYTQLQDLYISSYKLFLDEERYTDALKALFRNILLSLSGCRNNYLIGYKKISKLKNEQIMKNYSPLKIDSYVATSICKLKEYYNENILSDVYNEFIGPYNLCTYEMFREVTALIFNSSILELSEYDKIIRDLFIKKLKQMRFSNKLTVSKREIVQ